jgi:hypothetical protein
MVIGRETSAGTPGRQLRVIVLVVVAGFVLGIVAGVVPRAVSARGQALVSPVAQARLSAGSARVAPSRAVQAGGFVALAGVRVLDTRVAGPAAAAHGTVQVHLLGTGGVPAGEVAAVALTLTVVGAAESGYLTVYPAGTTRPATSNLNFAAGQTVANAVVVPVGTGGAVSVYNGSAGATEVLVDVAGFYRAGAATAPGAFAAIRATRLLDTRTSTGGARPGARGTVSPVVLGAGGVPASGVSAVLVTIAATRSSASGYVTAYASGGTRPTASNVNFASGRTVADTAVVPVGTDGRIALYNGSAASVDVLVDVAGYYRSGTPNAPGAFSPTGPGRLLDTRISSGAPAPVAGGTVAFDVLGRLGVPASNVSAVALTVTATAPTAGGHVTAYPNQGTRPNVSALNFAKGQTVAGFVIVPVGVDGKVALYNGSAGRTQLVADVAGYYRGGAGSALGTISGKITEYRGASAIAGLRVVLYDGPEVVAVTTTATTGGAFTLAGLAPASPGYAVCVNGTPPTPIGNPPEWQCYDGFGWDGAVPVDYTPVAVLGGVTHPGVDMDLAERSTSLGAIGGRVTTTDGAPLAGVRVQVFNISEGALATGSSAANGGYLIRGLGPSVGGYRVCFDTYGATGGTSTTGYLDRCYGHAAWAGPGNPVPSNATPVSANAGATTSGIDVALGAGGAIHGTVHASSGDATLAGVKIQVFDVDHQQQIGGDFYTGLDGQYTVLGLSTSSAVLVCFVGGHGRGGPSPTGYVDACYHANGAPAGPTPVAVTAGSTTGGVDAALDAGGRIYGTVRDAANSLPLADIEVDVYDSPTHILATSDTGEDGGYEVRGLPPGSYSVCFWTPVSDDYRTECYQDRAWDGPGDPVPPGTTPVPVTAQTSTRIDAALNY